jgi:quinoprotein glucose dehydrogenase
MEAARNVGRFTPTSSLGTIVYPFSGGGAIWGGGSFDPIHNRLFVNTSNAMHLITLIPRAPNDEDRESSHDSEYAPMNGTPYGMTREVMVSPLGVPCNAPPWGSLSAIDMDTGAIAWRTTLGTTEDIAPLGLALATGTPNLGGPLVTDGGLVFIAAAMDRYLRAFDASDGHELWRGRLPAGGQATPMSYEWEGRQYVVLAAGGHGEADTPRGDYVVAFALPRDGDPRPSFVSRLIDHPGGRFSAGVAGVVAALIALAALLLMRRKRRSP